MPKTKIAIYTGELPPPVFINRLINGLAREGCAVYLFGAKKRKVSYGKNVFVKAYSENRFLKLLFLVKYTLLLTLFKSSEKKKLDQYINRNSSNKLMSKLRYYPVLWHKPDVFHLQWAKSITTWDWVQDFGIKLVLSLRGAHINYSPHTISGLAENYCQSFPKIDGFHAVSKAIAAEAQKYGANPDKIKVVYSGLPESDFSSYSKPQNKTFRILSIGRNHWIKGYNYALDTMKILSGKGVNFKYTIIGAKDYEELEFQKADLGLEKSVEFTGNIPFQEVQKMMYESDLVLLPSVEEGIANVVLEAMQIGTLVLSTNCGGMNEVIENRKNGFIIPVRNPQKMAEAIQKIILLPEEEKQNIIQKAKATIKQNHTEAKMVSDMISLYNKVL
ncbi:MAG: glycosyltransferase family 4 protein [Flavobacteriaceae bacterium]|jgi:colanic acid/amylovoran biosynthesis glycosyltransferase|nr:glycosyltransferase family 4 protein [Flavobacteriaceae bacterium]